MNRGSQFWRSQLKQNWRNLARGCKGKAFWGRPNIGESDQHEACMTDREWISRRVIGCVS